MNEGENDGKHFTRICTRNINRTVPFRIKNESTRNHLEHLSAQEYLSSSLLHPSGSVNSDPFGQQARSLAGQQETETLLLFSIKLFQSQCFFQIYQQSI